MLYKGPEKIRIEKRDGRVPIISIEADASFSAYGLDKGKRSLLLGPFKPDARQLRYRLAAGTDHIEVATAKSTFWQLSILYVPDGKEHLDPTPIEIPAGFDKPPSLRDEMRRFIREEFARSAVDAEDAETFEEADDFDIDEDPDPFSQYEVMDMVEEEPIDTPETPSEDAGATNEDNPTPSDPPPKDVSASNTSEAETPAPQ